MATVSYTNPNNSIGTGDFSDPRVILVRKDDPRICARPESECHIEQACDSPTYVAVGASATDEQLAKVTARYGVPIADLFEFRNAASLTAKGAVSFMLVAM